MGKGWLFHLANVLGTISVVISAALVVYAFYKIFR